MPNEMLMPEPLSPQDAALLTALFKSSGAYTPWVEVGEFRHAQLEHRKAIDRLEQVGYIRKERIHSNECYCVSLTAMSQLRAHQLVAEVLDTAEAMWIEFRDHFKNSKKAPLSLRTVAQSVGKPIELIDIVHIYMLEWWRTPRCITNDEAVDQLVVVDEQVHDHESFDDCIEELRQVQSRRLQSAPNGFITSPWPGDSQAPSVAPLLPSFLEPSWFGKLPPHAQALMREMHTASHSGLVALTAMGIRAVIDVVADHLLGAAGWGFEKKLTALCEAGQLTPIQHEALSAVVEVGHAAAHRAHVPSERDVLLMFEVLNHVLCSAYGLQNTPAELKARTPPKPNVAKGSKAS